MQVVKKYANRKLYHTNRKQYITLEGIAHLIQSGRTVHVIDNETGDDITSEILAQVVASMRKHGSYALPVSMLTNLIQLGGSTLANLRQAVLASLSGRAYIETTIQQRLDSLVDVGKLTPEEANRLRHLLIQHPADQEIPFPRLLYDNIPSRSDILRLHQQVDALAARIEHIIQQDEPGGE